MSQPVPTRCCNPAAYLGEGGSTAVGRRKGPRWGVLERAVRPVRRLAIDRLDRLERRTTIDPSRNRQPVGVLPPARGSECPSSRPAWW
jgi:hypothetical protein